MTKATRILLAEDHPLYRTGLRQMLEGEKSLAIVGETGNGAEALRLARELRPDVLVLDIDLPGLNGLDVARARQRESLAFDIIFLTMYREADMFDAAMDLGAKGYILKECATAEILQGIRAIATGEHYISPALSGLLVSRAARAREWQSQTPGLASLTPAERRILALIASDRTSKEIAETLNLSVRTVENHRTNMSTKLGLRGSHSLLKFAFEHKGQL